MKSQAILLWRFGDQRQHIAVFPVKGLNCQRSNHGAIIVEQYLSIIILAVIIGRGHPAFVEQLQLLIKQQCYQVKLFIFFLNFKHHDLLFILTVDGAVYLIFGKYGNACCIKFHRFGKFFSFPIHLNSHTVYNTFFLVLVDHIKKIGIGNKVNIEGFLGKKIKVNNFLRLHIIIKDAQFVFPPDIFIYQEITIHLPDDLKIDIPAIFLLIIRIGYLLGNRRKRQDKESGQYKKKEPLHALKHLY